MPSYDPVDVPENGMYFLLNATIAPRPVAWISSVASDGTLNLAPHSYTTVLSPDPPIVGFVSIGQKDTLRNCLESGEFVYNIAGYDLAKQMNITAANFPPDISEFSWAGLTPLASDRVVAPRVAECPISYECEVAGIVRIGDTNNFLVQGEIKRAHIDERVLTDNRVDILKLDPVTRLSGSLYARVGSVYSLRRPTYQSLLDDAAARSAETNNGNTAAGD